MKIHIYVEGLTPERRAFYLKALYGTDESYGMLDKYAFATGFKPVCYDKHTWEYGVEYRNAPEEYITPIGFIIGSTHVSFMGDNLAYLNLDNKTFQFGKYTYNTAKFFCGFIKFVKKVYPEIAFEHCETLEQQDDIQLIASSMYLNIMLNYDAIFAYYRLLTDEEIKLLDEYVSPVNNEGLTVYQYYCEACAKYTPDSPYHIEYGKEFDI